MHALEEVLKSAIIIIGTIQRRRELVLKATTKVWITLACALGASLIGLSTIDTNQVSAATRGVSQTRTVATIEEFPESYQTGLRSVQAVYPNATFIYYDTGLDWYDDLLAPGNEMSIGRNLVPASSPTSWKRADPEVYNMETDEYKQIEPGWNAASQAIIEYYMDPRNFFNSTQIFQFAQLSYNESQTVAGVEKLLENSFMSSSKGPIVESDDGRMMTYAEALVEIGEIVNVSPYMLASRIIQEQGRSGTVLCNGNGYEGNYSGAYNYFNVNACGSSTASIIENGLSYARNHGWTTPYRGLLGGAQVVASWYIDKGVDTLYLQHFNVSADESGRVGYAPYMTNIRAPESETKNLHRASSDTEAPYVFIIPVYENMPINAVPKPDGDGNGNYWLKNISLNGTPIEHFVSANSKYTIYLEESVNTATITAESYRSVNMDINGKLKEEGITVYEKSATLNFGYNEFLVNVEAENGTIMTYLLNIVRDNGEPYYSFAKLDISTRYAILSTQCSVERMYKTVKTLNCTYSLTDANGNLKQNEDWCSTGDMITVRDLSNEIIFQKTIILLGDIDGDGQITHADREILTNHKLKLNSLNSMESIAADIDRSDTIDTLDIVAINKTIVTRPKKLSDTNILFIYDTAFDDKSFNVGLTAPEGTYVIEGYLTYNNNFIKAVDCNNTGSIHFIIINGEIKFANGRNSVEFISNISNATAEMETRYTTAINNNNGQVINLTPAQALIQIHPVGLQLIAQNTTSTAFHDGPAMILELHNLSGHPITNVSIELPEGLKTANGDTIIEVDEMVGDMEYSLYTNDLLQSGNYQKTFIGSYTTDNGTIDINQTLYYNINKCNHAESAYTYVDDSTHVQECSACQLSEVDNHTYALIDGVWICTKCGHSKNYTMVLTANEFENHQEGAIAATIIADEEEVDYSNFQFQWFLDSELTSASTNIYTVTLPNINNHTVVCIATNNQGVVLRETIDVKNIPTDFKMHTISCTTLIVQMTQEPYVFKIDDGDWQKSSTFKGLETGKTYKISRMITDMPDTEEFIYVATEHAVKYKNQNNATCTTNATEKGRCSRCNKTVEIEIPESKIPHNFKEYIVVKEPTCQGGGEWAAACDYNCGVADVIKNDNLGNHSFVDYIYNNDATCTSNGTKTGRCAYGCNSTNTIEAENTAIGHFFTNYQPVDNARIGECSHGCGEINTIEATLRIIDCIDITVGNLYGGQAGISRITTKTKGYTFDNYVLTNGDTTITKESARGLIEKSQIYVLSEISFNIDSGYQFGDKIQFYINDELMDCEYTIENGKISFYNLGRFKT